jgi:hypothetical protein
MQTIKVSTVSGNQVRFQGRKVHYCGVSILGTVCETHALRMAAFGVDDATSTLRAPGNWPDVKR